MFVEDNIQFKAERYAVKMLRLFDTIPYNLMEQFLEKKNKHLPDYKAKETLKSLLSKRIVMYSPADKCYRLIGKIPKNIDKICAFAVYLHLSKTNEVKIHFADYPFYYIFQDNHRLFQLINYSDDGVYKLNFRKNMQNEKSEFYNVIPVIMMINSTASPFKDVDSSGNLSLIPREDYYIANVTFVPTSNDLDKIEVSIKKYKGGTLNEY